MVFASTLHSMFDFDGTGQRAPPLGIAAANIEVEGTTVCASTLHSMFDFDGNYESKLDFSKTTRDKERDLIELDVFFLDEVHTCIAI